MSRLLSVTFDSMTPATATRPVVKKTVISRNEGQSLYASTQSRFATSQLIQNLGSSNVGAQFFFVSGLRTAYGRD